MIGVALGVCLWWSIRPLRLRLATARTRPANLIFPLVLVAATVQRLSESLGLICFALLVPAAVLLGSIQHRPPAQEDPQPARHLQISAGLLVSLVTWLSIRDVLGDGDPRRALVSIVATGAIMLMLIRARRGAGLDGRSAIWAGGLFLAFGLFQGGLTGQEWVACSETFDKCTPAGKLYRGPFPSENTLAFMAALVAMGALRFRGMPRNRILLVVLALVTGLTGSRTSLVALAIGGLAALIFSIAAVKRSRGGFRSDRLVALISTPFIAAGGLWLTFTAAPGSFSLRGSVWAQARSILSVTSFWGLGRGRYQALLDAGWFRGHYPHSQYLLLQFFGGSIAVVLFVAAMVAALFAIRSPTRWGIGAGAAPVVFALTFGLTEVAWNPLGMAADLWPILLIMASIPLDASIAPRLARPHSSESGG